jgi:hypothetical protein
MVHSGGIEEDFDSDVGEEGVGARSVGGAGLAPARIFFNAPRYFQKGNREGCPYIPNPDLYCNRQFTAAIFLSKA